MGLHNKIKKIRQEADRTLVQLALIESALDRIQQRMEVIKVAEKTIQELLAEMDTATTGVATRMQSYIDQLTAANATAEEVAAAKAGIQAEIDKLNAMGTGGTVEPANP